MGMKAWGLALIAALVIPFAARAATITPAEAAAHIGEQMTVCGLVASAHYARRSRAHPTFLDFGAPYPRQPFTVVIFGDDRPAFGQPETLAGTQQCVTGTIEPYRGKPEMILHQPSQIHAAP